MSPIIIVGIGILLFGLGLGAGYWLAFGQRKRDSAKANNIQIELDDYRRQVAEHFGETAQQFQALGQQYQSLYKHMAQGADTLCDPAQSEALLGFSAGNAAAITTNPAGDLEVPPDVIRDYAAAEENEPPIVDPEIEVPQTAELLADSPVPDGITAEPPAEEVTVEKVDAPAAVETERRVH